MDPEAAVDPNSGPEARTPKKAAGEEVCQGEEEGADGPLEAEVALIQAVAI